MHQPSDRQIDRPVDPPAALPPSGLPSLMMPCPACAGRMVYQGVRASSADMEDTVYACRRCGAELIRSSVRKAPRPETGGKRSARAA